MRHIGDVGRMNHRLDICAVMWCNSIYKIFSRISLFFFSDWRCTHLRLSSSILRLATYIIIPISRDEIQSKSSARRELNLYHFRRDHGADHHVSFILVFFLSVVCDIIDRNYVHCSIFTNETRRNCRKLMCVMSIRVPEPVEKIVFFFFYLTKLYK